MFAGKDEGFEQSEMRGVDDVRQVNFREFELRGKLTTQLPDAVEEVEEDGGLHFRLAHPHDPEALEEPMTCVMRDRQIKRQLRRE